MLEAYSYVALLYSKNAELDALRHLDPSIKPNIFPIFGVRPGQFNDFNNSIEKYKDALDGMRIGLTLDDSKVGKSKKSPAREQFDGLFNPVDGFKNFFDFVEEWEAAIPVLCSLKGRYLELESQIENAAELDRGFLVRIRQTEAAHFFECLGNGTFDDTQCSFVIDAEWAQDILQLENWVSQTVNAIANVRPDAEIICISSSFPRNFSAVEGRGVFSNDDREMFERVRAKNNAANLKYGDWGSTRTASESMASTPRPRIDIPTERDWISFRQREKKGRGFPAVSAEAEADKIWASTPDCWGKRMIELTARQRPQSIRGTQSANAARINLHLTVQSMVGVMDVIPEEPFTDDF